MPQCEKVLENGERCSNPAVPGTPLCEKHQPRIRFRPVSHAEAESASEPPVADHQQQAQPSPAGEEPSFPGLHADERNVLVAPQAIIWLRVQPGASPARLFDRLVCLLGSLSQVFTLPGQVNLQRRENNGDVLVHLTPSNAGELSLSALYDAAAWAARLVDARLYVGQDQEFIRYRDADAPRGYDAPALKRSKKKKRQKTQMLRLVDQRGAYQIPLAEFSPWSLSDFLMRVAPLPEAGGPVPEQVYAIAPPALHRLLARYFHAHHLHYGLAQLQGEAARLLLFEINPRPEAPVGRTVPHFVLDYLTRLHRVSVLTQAHQTAEQRILLQWRHRCPLAISNIAAAFEPEELVLLLAGAYPNLRVNPAPAFIDGDLLAHVHASQATPLELTPQPVDDNPHLQLPVLLRPDRGPTPPIAAIIVDGREITWLRPLLYRLSGKSLRVGSLCIGQDRAVLVGGDLPLEGIPFGLPLRRLGDTGLFIPLRQRLVPELPWEILRAVLDIRDDRYTFLNGAYRLDLPVADFAPLSRVLVADPERSRVSFRPRRVTHLQELHWTISPPPGMEKPAIPTPGERRGILDGLKSVLGSGKPAPAGRSTQEAQQELRSQLLKQARVCEDARDYLAAAICYSLLDDSGSSARCYRRAAEAHRPRP